MKSNYFFSGATTFRRALQLEGIKLSQPVVNAILYSIPDYINKIRRLTLKKTRPYRVVGSDITWEADIGFMPKNHGYNAFLLVIDVFSRKIFTHLLKRKNNPALERAFLAIKKQNNGNFPERIQGDKDIYNLKYFFKEHNVYCRQMYGKNKAALAELSIYKLKRRLYSYISTNEGAHWSKVLPQMTKNINNTSEEVLGGLKPSDIKTPFDDKLVWEKNPQRPTLLNYKKAEKAQEKYEKNNKNLKVGDSVLFDKGSKPFDKSYKPKVICLSLFLLNFKVWPNEAKL